MQAIHSHRLPHIGHAGDAVFGLAPGCLGPCVFLPAGLLAPMPPHLSFAAAATTPTVYTTVFAAFQQGRGVGPHTRVLVHAGTGGVGLAALQVATALGCRVLATAGSPAKRATLRCSDVLATADSRSTDFADTVAVATAAGGIGLVLNSLTSPGGCGIVCVGYGVERSCNWPVQRLLGGTLLASCPAPVCRHGGSQPGWAVARRAIC